MTGSVTGEAGNKGFDFCDACVGKCYQVWSSVVAFRRRGGYSTYADPISVRQGGQRGSQFDYG